MGSRPVKESNNAMSNGHVIVFEIRDLMAESMRLSPTSAATIDKAQGSLLPAEALETNGTVRTSHSLARLIGDLP